MRAKVKRVTIGGRPPDLNPPASAGDAGRTEFNVDSAVKSLGSLGARAVPNTAAESWIRRGGSDASPDLAANLAAILPPSGPARAAEASPETAEPAGQGGPRNDVADADATALTTIEPAANAAGEVASGSDGSAADGAQSTVSMDVGGGLAEPEGGDTLPRPDTASDADPSTNPVEAGHSGAAADRVMPATLPIADPAPTVTVEPPVPAVAAADGEGTVAAFAAAAETLPEQARDASAEPAGEPANIDQSGVVAQLADPPKETRGKRSGSRNGKAARVMPSASIAEAAQEYDVSGLAEATPQPTPTAVAGEPPSDDRPYRNGAMVADAVAYLQSSLALPEPEVLPGDTSPAGEGTAIAETVATDAAGEMQPDSVATEPPARRAEVADAPRSDPMPEEPVAALTTAEPAAVAEPAVTPAKSRITPLTGILIGAAVGALVSGLATAMLLPRVMQSVDLRLAPVIDRINKAELRMTQTDAVISRLNNDIATAIDDGGTVAGRIAAQSAQLSDIQRQLTAGLAAAATKEVDSSVFAVAVVQLRSAFYSGRPFEAELVNVFTLSRGEEGFVAPLNILSGPARTGVPTVGLLRQKLPPFIAAAGLRIGPPESTFDYSVAVLGQYLGLATQAYAIEAGNDIVTNADRRLMSGDVAGAVAVLSGLDPSLLRVFQPWMDAARAYLRTEAAVSEMTATVIESLHQKMGAANAG